MTVATGGDARDEETRDPATAAREALENWADFDLPALVDVARQYIGVPMAAITVLEGHQFHFALTSGTDPFCTDEGDAMCKHSMGVPGIFQVRDTLADERMAELPYVDGRRASLRFYASAPIYAAGGEMVGRFCLFDTEVRTLDPDDELLLAKLAHTASRAIQRGIEAKPRGVRA
ncbi:GAF domain-containing protein [Nocardioidaceae bacterium]|nr:GAF domain-containing protein [Nocardioidaceae bacterium]